LVGKFRYKSPWPAQRLIGVIFYHQINILALSELQPIKLVNCSSAWSGHLELGWVGSIGGKISICESLACPETHFDDNLP
jgi:hypothetical protein